MEKLEKRRMWEERIAHYCQSGQTQARWCEEHRVPLHQFKYWHKRINDQMKEQTTSTTQWIPVPIDETKHNPSEKEGIQIQMRQATIEVKPGFDSHLFIEIIRALESV